MCSFHNTYKMAFWVVNSYLHFWARPFLGLTFILHLTGWRGSRITPGALPTYLLFSSSLSIKDSALRLPEKSSEAESSSHGLKEGHKFRIHDISVLQHAITCCLGKSSTLHYPVDVSIERIEHKNVLSPNFLDSSLWRTVSTQDVLIVSYDS